MVIMLCNFTFFGGPMSVKLYSIYCIMFVQPTVHLYCIDFYELKDHIPKTKLHTFPKHIELFLIHNMNTYIPVLPLSPYILT